MQWTRLSFVIAHAACASVATGASESIVGAPAHTNAAESPLAHSGQSPALWIENRGQWPEAVEFAVQLPGCMAWVERGALVLACDAPGGGEREVVRFVFEGADPEARWVGADPMEGRFHFYLGDDPERWTRNARTFGALRCQTLYAGVDVELHLGSRGIKYDLIAAAGAAIGELAIRCVGSDGIGARENGELEIRRAAGAILQLPGESWQVLPDGGRRSVTPRWIVAGDGRLRLEVPGYDPSQPLVVDPELIWSTYLGASLGSGQGDLPGPVAVGPDGDAYIVGRADGYDFPQMPAELQQQRLFAQNVFVTRLRAADGALLYSVILGGSGTERGLDVSIDEAGRAVVGGWTLSEDFPVTHGAFDSNPAPSGWTGFVTKLFEFGDDLMFSTLMEGQTSGAQVHAVAGAPDGGVVVGGYSYGPDFPVTPGAFDTTWDGGNLDGFVAKLDSTGSSLLWSTFLGGTSTDRLQRLEVGADGTVTATGETGSVDFPTTPGSYLPTKSSIWSLTGFVTRLTPDGTGLVWSSFLGANDFFESTHVWDLALDAFGTVCLIGETTSPNFPTTIGAVQEDLPGTGGGFVTRMRSDGSGLLYSTYLGSPAGSAAFSVTGDASGVFTVAGSTPSGFPVTPGAFDTEVTGTGDFFVSRIRPDGRQLLYSTFLGGTPTDINTGIAITPEGRITVCGEIFFPGGYPTTPGAPFPEFVGGQTDAAITTFDLLLEGVREYGISAPSCLGPVRIGVTEMPAAGAAEFGLYASGAPPESNGELLISWGPAVLDDEESPGAVHLVDPARLIAGIPVTSGAFGYTLTPFPLRPEWAGRRLYAQYVFHATPECSTPSKQSASFALELEVQ